MKIEFLMCFIIFGLFFFTFGIYYNRGLIRSALYTAIGSLKAMMSKHFSTAPRKSGYWLSECKCMKHLNDTIRMKRLGVGDSTCSDEANFLGPGQKVVSYSLFTTSLKDIKHFARGIRPNLHKIKALYPGWYLRLYTNINVKTRRHHLCELACKNDQLIWCDIHKIPKYGNLSQMNPRMWRFLPFGDPTVSTFLSRDLDTDISKREQAAVTEWENSNSIFHMMRDITIAHDTPMLAGMLGVKNYRLTPWESAKLREETITLGQQSQWKGQDQWALRRLIYKTVLVTEMMTHDSYTCEQYPGTVPFPTKRDGHTHVGDSIRKKDNYFRRPLVTCPRTCRPRYGQDWEYC